MTEQIGRHRSESICTSCEVLSMSIPSAKACFASPLVPIKFFFEILLERTTLRYNVLNQHACQIMLRHVPCSVRRVSC